MMLVDTQMTMFTFFCISLICHVIFIELLEVTDLEFISRTLYELFCTAGRLKFDRLKFPLVLVQLSCYHWLF